MNFSLLIRDCIFVSENLIVILVQAESILGLVSAFNSSEFFGTVEVVYPEFIEAWRSIFEENMLDWFERHISTNIHVDIKLSLASWAFFVPEVNVCPAGTVQVEIQIIRVPPS